MPDADAKGKDLPIEAKDNPKLKTSGRLKPWEVLALFLFFSLVGTVGNVMADLIIKGMSQ